jgi:hypothetical protein
MPLPPKTQEMPYPAEVEEAKKRPNAEIYRIKGQFGLEEDVPCAAIIGAWKVNSEGKIVGEFISNPNFDPKYEEIRTD